MPILRTASDSIAAANQHIKFPKPTQLGQWDSSAPFMLPPAGNAYWDAKTPKQFADGLKEWLPSNINLRDYLKYNSPTEVFDPKKKDAEYTVNGRRSENAPENLYATVEIDGHVVAKIFNSGLIETPDLLPSHMPDEVRAHFNLRSGMEAADAAGPQLAQKRAEDLAAAFGAEIVYAGTALTQNEWGDRFAYQWLTDGTRLTNKQVWMDKLSAVATALTGSTALEAQLFGQETETADRAST